MRVHARVCVRVRMYVCGCAVHGCACVCVSVYICVCAPVPPEGWLSVARPGAGAVLHRKQVVYQSFGFWFPPGTPCVTGEGCPLSSCAPFPATRGSLHWTLVRGYIL